MKFFFFLLSLAASTIIIIGAGISAISTAKTFLLSNNSDFIILEASSLAGGRIKSTTFANVTLELGANWVEGLDLSNPIAQLAHQVNLTYSVTDYDDKTVLDDDGNIISDDALETEYDTAMECANNLLKTITNDISIKAALLFCGWSSTSVYGDYLEAADKEEEYASELDEMSANFTLKSYTERDFGDKVGLVTDQRGYRAIVDYLLDIYKIREKIIFNQQVVGIDYSSDTVKVTTATGKVYTGSQVVSTVSLGVLQSNSIKFTPRLPSPKLLAIDKFQMVTYTKVFLEFDYQFWADTEFTYLASKEKGYYVDWQNLMLPKYHGDILRNSSSHLLMVTVTGDHSRRIERMSDSQISAEITQVLQKMYPSKQISPPRNILLYRWLKDPLFRGSFTSWPVGMTLQDHENLCSNVEGKLWFGGEMCSRKYFGYVQGGYLAGIDVANDLINNMGE